MIATNVRAPFALAQLSARDRIQPAAVFLDSPAASFVTGQVLCVDGDFLASF